MMAKWATPLQKYTNLALSWFLCNLQLAILASLVELSIILDMYDGISHRSKKVPPDPVRRLLGTDNIIQRFWKLAQPFLRGAIRRNDVTNIKNTTVILQAPVDGIRWFAESNRLCTAHCLILTRKLPTVQTLPFDVTINLCRTFSKWQYIVHSCVHKL